MFPSNEMKDKQFHIIELDTYRVPNGYEGEFKIVESSIKVAENNHLFEGGILIWFNYDGLRNELGICENIFLYILMSISL